jgi:hypothetical protein
MLISSFFNTFRRRQKKKVRVYDISVIEEEIARD